MPTLTPTPKEITIICPKCKAKHTTDPSIINQQVQCSQCNHTFTAQNETTKKFVSGCLGLILIIITTLTLITTLSPSTPTTPANPIEAHFSQWDGSHKNLTQYIKDHLKDPDSYKHLKTTYSQQPNQPTYRVNTTYTATNSFGARVTTHTKAIINTQTGEIVRIIQ